MDWFQNHLNQAVRAKIGKKKIGRAGPRLKFQPSFRAGPGSDLNFKFSLGPGQAEIVAMRTGPGLIWKIQSVQTSSVPITWIDQAKIWIFS